MAWDQTTRQQAIDLYVTDGASEASRRTGVPVRTVRYWANAEALAAARDQRLTDGAARLAKQHAQLREEIRLRTLEVSADLLDRISAEHEKIVVLSGGPMNPPFVERVPLELPEASDVKAYAVAFGVLLDKYRLEMGEHTTHTRTESTDDVDRRIAQLVDEHERRSQADHQPSTMD
jgi:DNA-binding transcriptional MerR regulator